MGRIIGLIPKAEKHAAVKAAPVPVNETTAPEIHEAAPVPEESKPKKKSK